MQLRRFICGIVLVGTAALGTLGCSDHDFEKYTATLEGSQEAPPVSSSASGNAVLLVSQDGSRVDVTVTITNAPTTAITVSHIHRAPRGTSGPIIHNLWVPPTHTDLFDAAHPIGRTLRFSADDFTNLVNGNLYVNVHTSANRSGELRGQLVRQ